MGVRRGGVIAAPRMPAGEWLQPLMPRAPGRCDGEHGREPTALCWGAASARRFADGRCRGRDHAPENARMPMPPLDGVMCTACIDTRTTRRTNPGPSAMSHDYDPDDNFDHAFGDDADIDEEAASEALVWQLLLLINPGDEDAALQQFAAYQDALQNAGDHAEPIELLRDAIDWKAGFFVADDDPRTLIDSLDELAARYGLRIDWDIDLDDDDALDAAEPPALLATAYDRLREHHYTLWTYETGSAHHAGWMTQQRDDEALALVARALGIHARAGAG
jgi:hypothetical protein